jgi:hypothetical protein
MTKHVPYYRVSTDRQGRSGLGLEALQATVTTYLAGIADGEILAEFTEVESGKKVGPIWRTRSPSAIARSPVSSLSRSTASPATRTLAPT